MDNERSWSTMETDCLVEIFRRVDLHDLFLSVSLVCKPWLDAASNPLCWKKLDFRQLDVLPWSNFSRSFALQYSLPFPSFTHLLKFAISRGRESVTTLRFPLKLTTTKDLALASKMCPNMKHVAFPIMSESEEEQIPQILSRWKKLESLEMESMPSNFLELVKKIGLCCSQFSCLIVSGGSVRERDAIGIVKSLPALKKLELKKSFLHKKELMTILNGCRELESLSLIECIGFDKEDEEIRDRISGIKVLQVRGCKLYYEVDAYDKTELWIYSYVC